mmetsp:Transcript_7578/g.11037  ORF Transcript_7578/g.11037 Transcript_7578/m.11037 type:complete len:1056 (+) Transcript_7578:163-3330(+)
MASSSLKDKDEGNYVDDVENFDEEEEEENLDPVEQKPRNRSFIARASTTGKSTFFSDQHGNLKFVNVIVRHPICIFFTFFAICIFCTLVLSRLVRREGQNPITEDTNAYDIYDARSIAYDSLRIAKEDVEDFYETNSRRLRKLEGQQVQEDVGDRMIWIYKAKTEDGLFTNEAIPIMRAAEATILEHEDYEKYCVLEYDLVDETTGETLPPQCEKPLSVMNIYYASEWNSTVAAEVISEFKTNPSSVDIYNRLAPCLDFSLFCDEILGTVSANATAWAEDMKVKIDSIIENWDGKGDLNPNVEQVTEFIAYMNLLFSKSFNVVFYLDSEFSVDNQKSMFSRSFFSWGQLLEGTDDEDESEEQLKEFVLDNLVEEWDKFTASNNNPVVQSYYFMGSLIFDIILRILSNDGLKAVGSLLAVFFYLRFMLGSWFLAAVGMFEIFMSLPLAWLYFSYIFQIKYFSSLNTLCIFIVTAIGADDIFVFMDSYKQSAGMGPEVLKDLETRMSWVYRRSGSAMLLTSATTCLAFLTTLFSPIAGTRSFGVFAAFVILLDYVLVMTLFCTSVVIYHDRFETKKWCCNCSFWSKCDPTPTEKAIEDYQNGVELKTDPISRFFKEKFGPFMLNARNRIIIGVVLIAWIIVAAIFSSKLEPTTTAEQFLDDDHPLQIGATILTENFPQTQEDRSSKVHFIWGLDEVDRAGVNQLLDPENVGTASFNSEFTFDAQCQTAILSACDMLASDPDLKEFILLRDGSRSIDCFVQELGAFNVDNNANCLDVRIGDWQDEDWQVSSDNLTTTMEAFVSKRACEPDGQSVRNYYQNIMGWDGSGLRYAGISIESSILNERRVLAEDTVRVHYDKFIQVAEKFDENVGKACKTKTIMTDLDQKFVFMNNQRIYRTSAVSSSMIGVLVSFVVIFIATRKLHLAFFATVSIFSVLISVIGAVTIAGWTLGVIEAILFGILAGFSVDYVIHLAHAYSHAEGDVEERVMAAYAEMGTSVFSGMLTSVVASIPLFFCTLTFFAKFGTFLCLTILFSWIFANLGFMGLLATFKISMDRKCL